MLKVKTDYIPLGHPNRPGTKLYGLKARIWHGTANTNRGAGDEMHKLYVGRAYKKIGGKFYEADGQTPFVFGCAHVYVDQDSATIVVPLDEYVPGAGDRQLPYDNGYKGQTKLASQVFDNKQNYYSWQIELCMNDMSAWSKVLENAVEFVKEYMPDPGIEDYRHYDLTTKNCPSPLINLTIKEIDPRWVEFRDRIKAALTKDPLEEALKILQGKVIVSPNYWLANARKGLKVDGEYAGMLIQNMANYIKSIT
jgi:hypothetical protein